MWRPRGVPAGVVAPRARAPLVWTQDAEQLALVARRAELPPAATRQAREDDGVEAAAAKLHAAANDATRKSGWGRIKHRDGTFEDIAPHDGGIIRTVLDNVDPISSDDESLDAEEPESCSEPFWVSASFPCW